jgi:hypothetical protein
VTPDDVAALSRRKMEVALVRGAMTAARALGVSVDRAMVLGVIRSSTDLEDCAGRLADLLSTAARAQAVSLEGKVSDP